MVASKWHIVAKDLQTHNLGWVKCFSMVPRSTFWGLYINVVANNPMKNFTQKYQFLLHMKD